MFCEDIDHAERMRQALVNENPDLAAGNSRYIMRITGDNDEGKAELDNFIDPGSRYPVIATTSRLMSTGVDAQTCKLIVLDRRIQSMTEFKQIIGRGTRVNEEHGKYFFTIIDFRKATELFADPQFDGDPVQVYKPRMTDAVTPEGEEPGEQVLVDIEDDGEEDDDSGRRVRYVVDDVPVSIIAERVQYYSPDGRLVTESLRGLREKARHSTVRHTRRLPCPLDCRRSQGCNSARTGRSRRDAGGARRTGRP